MQIWILFFKKEEIVSKWVNAGVLFNLGVSKFMNKFLIMIYNNQTLEEISSSLESKDCILDIFEKLKNLYEDDKYFNSLNDIATINDRNIDFDCQIFYQNIDNIIFKQLKNKFIEEKEKLYFTMYFFCEWSNVMMFKQYKTVYV